MEKEETSKFLLKSGDNLVLIEQNCIFAQNI